MRNRSRGGGFSLLELICSMSILAIVMVSIFGVFEMGNQSFHYASLRQGLQAEARIAYLQLNDDLRHSSFVSVTAQARPASVILPRHEIQGPQTVDRDGLCLAGVEDWAATGSTDSLTGFPNFDIYVVYYATADPEGRLVRQEVAPPIVGSYPNSKFSVINSMNNNPTANLHGIGRPRILSSRILAFQARRDDGKRLVNISLKFRGLGGRKPGGSARVDETFELSLHSYPENTYPKV